MPEVEASSVPGPRDRDPVRMGIWTEGGVPLIHGSWTQLQQEGYSDDRMGRNARLPHAGAAAHRAGRGVLRGREPLHRLPAVCDRLPAWGAGAVEPNAAECPLKRRATL